MAKWQLRDAVGQWWSESGQSAAPQSWWSKEEWQSLVDGKWQGWSDQQLADRFNPKVLGSIKLDPKKYYTWRDGKYWDSQGRWWDSEKNQWWK